MADHPSRVGQLQERHYEILGYNRSPASPAPSLPVAEPQRQVGRLRRSRTVIIEILYRTSPAWLVPDGRGLPYPGDWAGRIVSVRPAGHSWGPGDLADPKRGVIRLGLTGEEARACRRGEVRFGLEAAVRNGGAPPLRGRF